MGFVNVGPLELLVIGMIALIVLGPKRLPEAARSMGKGLREFRESLSGATVEEERSGEDDLPERG
jgi:sec-independent protein translocase protein TatA